VRPKEIKSKIFLDGGDPTETRETLKLLGFLDGQTTNPTLFAKNPKVQERIARGEKFSRSEVLDFYKKVVQEISSLIPQGSISVEVYADLNTKAEEILAQARELFQWIPNAHIKIPVTFEGLKAAEKAVAEGVRVNLTLCFTQEQAAAVFQATRGAKKGQVYVSPFVGRFDDRGENGMELIKNILTMYRSGDHHVEVVVASVRNLDHLLYSLQLEADIITVPFKVLKEWAEKGLPLPDNNYRYPNEKFKPIPYQEVNLAKNWQEYNLTHELTEVGIKRFCDDWNKLICS